MDLPPGPVGILWDIENCAIPSDVSPEEVATNIRRVLKAGAVTMFSAYGDFHSFPKRVREGCQRTGVKLVDVPNGRKDAADKAILVDMFLFALDNRPPSTIMLISGDIDFAQALHILGQRGYTIILVIPSTAKVSPALRSAGHFVWDWHSLARGLCVTPPVRPLMPAPRLGLNEISRYPMVFQTSENQDSLNEEAVMDQRMSIGDEGAKKFVSFNNLTAYPSNSTPWVSPAISKGKKGNGSQNVDEDPSLVFRSSDEFFDDKRVVLEDGSVDKNGKKLKEQLIKLLDRSGGRLSLSQVPEEYQKLFHHKLLPFKYGACKLLDLLQKFSSVMTVKGKHPKRIVYLKSSQARTANNTLSSLPPSKDREGAGRDIENGNEYAQMVSRSSGELADDKQEVSEEDSIEEKRLKEVRGRLVTILEQSGGFIAFNYIRYEYLKLFGHRLRASDYGARTLEDLVQKLSCVMAIKIKDAERVIYLKTSQDGTVNGRPLSSASPSLDKEGKGIHDVNEDVHLVSGSYDVKSAEEELIIKRQTQNMHRVKGKLINLLGKSGGCIALSRIPHEYEKFTGEPLCVLECGFFDLVDLLQKFSYVMTVEGEGANKLVYLNKCRPHIANGTPSSLSLGEDKEGGEIQKGNEDAHLLCRSSDGSFDKTEFLGESSSEEKTQQLRVKLVRLLEHSGGILAVNQFAAEYHKLFGQQLYVSEYGADSLATLLQKFPRVMRIKNRGTERIVYLNNYQASVVTGTPLSSPAPSQDKEERKGFQDVNEDAHLVSRPSDVKSAKEESYVIKRQKENMRRVKGRLVKLLGKYGGCLALSQIPGEYEKFSGYPLCVLECGFSDLLDLLQKFSYVMTVEGEGANKFLYLNNSQPCITANGTLSSLSPSEDKEGGQKGGEIQNGNEGAHLLCRSSDALFDKTEDLEESCAEEKRQQLRVKLVKLLEQSGGFLAFDHICQEYHKLFGQRLCVSEYGVSRLESLLNKFSSVITIKDTGAERLVYLKNYQAGISMSSPSLNNDEEGKGIKRNHGGRRTENERKRMRLSEPNHMVSRF